MHMQPQTTHAIYTRLQTITHTHTHTHTPTVSSIALGLVSAVMLHVHVEKKRCCDWPCSSQTPFERPRYHPSLWNEGGARYLNEGGARYLNQSQLERVTLGSPREGSPADRERGEGFGGPSRGSGQRSQTSCSVDNNMLCGR